jgi:uncharacterized protein YlxW (UPF0749 family)
VSSSAWLFAGTVLTVLTGTLVTSWNQRRHSPSGQASLMGASDLLLSQLQNRLNSLESRVSTLEKENDAYHRLYGPLP